MSSSSSQPQTETFQHYQVLKREDGTLWELGRGAMGVTYKAFDVNLRCNVALKVINAQFLNSEMARARFLREARAAAGLRHRNVASVYHLGDDSECFFYSMEFIDGETIEHVVTSKGTLTPAEALDVTLQTSRALGAASKQGLVHRDIKPANLMIVNEDDEEDHAVVKVIDFGLARSARSGEQSGAITIGGFVGTPQYASPEQIEEQALDVRSDIYSLGITLWYMLVGNPPFTGSIFRISSQHLTKDPPWEQLEAVPQPVRALLKHMLQKDPANRPQNAVKLRLAIEACLKQLEKASPAAPKRESARIVADTSTGSSAHPVDDTSIQGAAPSVGGVLAGRYALAALAGEGALGRLFRAYDRREGDREVAVNVFHPELRLSTQEYYQMQADLGKLQAAPHPYLLTVHSLDQIGGVKFGVSEWVQGFSLLDLLRHRGRLNLNEAATLIGQAVDAATHAGAVGLHRLELGSRQILVHFPGDLPPPGGAPALDRLRDQPLSHWPDFGLKINALAPPRDNSGHLTASGEKTMLLPTPAAGRDTQSSIRGLIEGSCLHGLGVLLHELLAGTPPEAGQDHTPLASLGEAGNAVLREALSSNPRFASENDFFLALLDACELRREDYGLPPRPEPDAAGATLIFEEPPSTAEISGGAASHAATVTPEHLAPEADSVAPGSEAPVHDLAAVSLKLGAEPETALLPVQTREEDFPTLLDSPEPVPEAPAPAVALIPPPAPPRPAPPPPAPVTAAPPAPVIAAPPPVPVSRPEPAPALVVTPVPTPAPVQRSVPVPAPITAPVPMLEPRRRLPVAALVGGVALLAAAGIGVAVLGKRPPAPPVNPTVAVQPIRTAVETPAEENPTPAPAPSATPIRVAVADVPPPPAATPVAETTPEPTAPPHTPTPAPTAPAVVKREPTRPAASTPAPTRRPTSEPTPPRREPRREASTPTPAPRRVKPPADAPPRIQPKPPPRQGGDDDTPNFMR